MLVFFVQNHPFSGGALSNNMYFQLSAQWHKCQCHGLLRIGSSLNMTLSTNSIHSVWTRIKSKPSFQFQCMPWVIFSWKPHQNWTFGSRDIDILVLLKTMIYKGNWNYYFALSSTLNICEFRLILPDHITCGGYSL